MSSKPSSVASSFVSFLLRFSVSETSGHRANWLLFISSASILVCITSSVFVFAFASICASAFRKRSLLSMAIVDKAAGSVCAMLSRDCLLNFSVSSCHFFAQKKKNSTSFLRCSTVLFAFASERSTFGSDALRFGCLSSVSVPDAVSVVVHPMS